MWPSAGKREGQIYTVSRKKWTDSILAKTALRSVMQVLMGHFTIFHSHGLSELFMPKIMKSYLNLWQKYCQSLIFLDRRRKTLISNRGRWSPLSLFRQVHLGVGKSKNNPPFSGLRAASTWEAVGFCGSHRQTDVLAKLSSWLGGWSPFCGDMAGTLPKCGNGGISDAVTSELGDRQSSHPVKTLLQYYGKSLEALPGVAYPGFRDNRSTLNTKTGFLKKMV